MGSRLQRWEELTLGNNEHITRLLGRIQQRFSPNALMPAVVQAAGAKNREAISFYRGQAYHQNPQAFFLPPTELPELRVSAAHPILDGEISTVSFRSGFEPVYPGYREDFEACPENRQVRTRVWKHPHGRSRGTLIAIHGWQMEDQGVAALALSAGYFFRLGLNVVLYELPHHGPRRCSGTSVFPSIDAARTNEGFAQAIYELRQIALLLQSFGETNIGVLGLSLGGYTAALWASLDPLACAICLSPISNILTFAETFMLHGADAEALLALGIARDRLFQHVEAGMFEEIFAVHCPLSYRPRVAEDRRLIIASTEDEVVPLEQARSLQLHWAPCRYEQLPGGHLGQMYAAKARTAVHEFLSSCGMADPYATDLLGNPSEGALPEASK